MPRDEHTSRTSHCNGAGSIRHTIRQHTVAVDPDTGYPTTVAVCVDCGRPQWRTDPDDLVKTLREQYV